MMRETSVAELHDLRAVDQAVKTIMAGGIIAFPTDTVYGIGVSIFIKDAINLLYQIKDRPKDKPIPVLIADISELDHITPPLNQSVREIITRFWPGALTVVLPMIKDLPEDLSNDRTVGIRVPDHELTRNLLRKSGPLAVTSANRSGQPSARTAAQVMEQLGGRIDLILDGGPATGGVPSTVLNCIADPPQILREGPIGKDQIWPNQ